MSTRLKDTRPTGGFNSLLLSAVDSALISTMGESAAAAIKFYLQVQMITKDPDAFRRQLEKFFSGSEAGSRLIESKIKRNLATLMMQTHSVSVSTDKLDDRDLKQFIDSCKSEFLLV
ncbi:MAG: hypothetical protein OK457_09760 [Thaumarchaeota archaeon]|nr:hypothetical protein [Nitrososphaerota archaeon]